MLRYPIIALLAVLLCLAFSSAAAGSLDDIEIGVVTYGPGNSMMSRYGHTAVVLADQNGHKEFYELAAGLPQSSFVPWYLSPRQLIYKARQTPRQLALTDSFVEGRSVEVRMLNLSLRQKQHFAALLSSYIEPGAADFEFQLYEKNCTTRVRDLLDRVLQGQLSEQLSSKSTVMSNRQHMQRGLEYRWWLRLGADFGVGRSGDHTTNAWRESFLPARLASLLDQVQVADDLGQLKPLVANRYTLMTATAKVEPVPDRPMDLALVMGLVGFLLALVVSRSLRGNKPGELSRWSAAWLMFNGLAGCLLAHMWWIGGERVTAWNENLLVYTPLSVLLVLIRHHRWRVTLAGVLGLSVMSAVLLKLLPGSQDNLGWLLLGLPPQLIVIDQLLRPYRISKPTSHHADAIRCRRSSPFRPSTV